jgi:ectoine hydroxylase-related dioxygenase (phytanoyl-CoA dioxygenase family)
VSEFYFEDGYQVFDTDLQDTLKTIQRKCIQIFNESALKHGLGQINDDSDIIRLDKDNHDVWVAAYDQIRYLPEIMGLANHPTIIEKVKSCGVKFPVFCGRSVFRTDMPNDKEHDFPPHQDYVYNHGSLNSITIWIPLQDVTVEMGALGVIPKSHLEGCVPAKEGLIVNPDLSKYVPMPMSFGQIIVFSQFLHHKSGLNASNKIRCSLQLRYNDLSDDNWASRHFYVNQTISEKTRDIDFKTKFSVMTVEN